MRFILQKFSLKASGFRKATISDSAMNENCLENNYEQGSILDSIFWNKKNLMIFSQDFF